MSCNQCGNVTLPNGSNGLNGYNAFTVTTASFVLPAVGASVSISVSASGQYTGIWAILGQIVYISDGVDAEYFEVTTAGTQTTIGVKNLGYVGTTVGNTFGSGSKVSPAGLQGAGTNGSNGTSLLGVSHAAAILAGLTYATFSTGTVSVPAARMDTNDDSLVIEGELFFNITTAAGTANARVLIGGISVSILATAYEFALSKNYPYLAFKIFVTRASATTANVRVHAMSSSFGLGTYATDSMIFGGSPTSLSHEILATGAITWASVPNIEIQGLVSDSNDTIKLGFYNVVSLKKV